MIGWIIFFTFMEIYSIGMCICAKRLGLKRCGLVLIPFAVFFYAEKIAGKFKILFFPVKKWGTKVIVFFIVTMLSYLFGAWAIEHQNPDYVRYLLDILWLVAGTCIGIVWLGISSSTEAILLRLNPFLSKIGSIACYLLLPVPFLLAFQEERPVRNVTFGAEVDKK